MLKWIWRFRFSGLWRHNDFLKLWAGQSVSLIGTQISFIALPLVAVISLDATPIQMGILTAMTGLPPLFIGIFAGVWTDRHRRRPIMIAVDWGRAALLLIIPIAAFLGFLRIELLYFVAFGMGALSLFFSVAYRSYLPSLVSRKSLVDANGKLEVSASGSEIVGPGIGGILIQIITAPYALIVDAFTFIFSAISLSFIRTKEPELAPSEGQASIWKDAGEGLKVVVRHPVLRSLTGCHGTVSMFNSVLEAVWLLYLTRELGISPALLGIIASSGGFGFLLGAIMSERTARWLGLGPAIITGVIVAVTGDLILPLAGGPTPLLVALLVMGQIMFGIGLTTYRVGQMSLRQSLTPNRLQGRMNATFQVVSLGVVPIGALLGGALGETIGLRSTLFIAVTGEFLSVVWLLLSPVIALRVHPQAGCEGLA